MPLSRFEKGMAVLRKVDPQTAEHIVDDLRHISPDLGRLTIEVGYGEIMSREGLDLRTRELLNIAMLGALGNGHRQLVMHIRGALNTGATKDEIVEVMIQVGAYAGFPAAYNILHAVQEVLVNEIIEPTR